MSDLDPWRAQRSTSLHARSPLRGVGAGVTWTLVALLIGQCMLWTIQAIVGETGPAGLLTGVVLAAIPVFPVVATFLWLDRYESEPAGLLAFAFSWGAGVATFVALQINTASIEAIKVSGGDPTAAVVFVAPVVEEVLKGSAVLLLLLARRREFDGVVDGIVYAGMAGIGFAFIENVLYLGRTVGSDDAATLFVFVLRCIVSPFAHPLFTCATGIGLGLAARTRNPLLKVVAPVLGLAVAVVLHAGWNLSASSGLQGFVSTYVLVQVPVFVLFGALAVVARSREGALIRRNLAVYSGTGWLSPGEVGMIGSLRVRRDARRWARGVGGPVAERAMADFQDLGSELAFLRERMVRGTARQDAQAVEAAMLHSMTVLRAQFQPRVTAAVR